LYPNCEIAGARAAEGESGAHASIHNPSIVVISSLMGASCGLYCSEGGILTGINTTLAPWRHRRPMNQRLIQLILCEEDSIYEVLVSPRDGDSRNAHRDELRSGRLWQPARFRSEWWDRHRHSLSLWSVHAKL